MRPRLIQGGTPPRSKEAKLTDAELNVMNLLAEAWNAYDKLPIQHPMDRSEFAFFIHGCQGLMGIRVARAADPDVWAIEDSAG